MFGRNRDKTVDNLECVLRASGNVDSTMDDFKAVFGFDDKHHNYSNVRNIVSAGLVFRGISSRLNLIHAEAELSAEYRVKGKTLLDIAAKLAGRPDSMTDIDYFDKLVELGRRKYSQTGKYSQECALSRNLDKKLEEISNILCSINSKLKYVVLLHDEDPERGKENEE